MLQPAIKAFFNLLMLNFATSLKCYTDVEAKQTTICNELEGFRTCFIKYNDSKFHPSAFPFGIVQKYQEATVIGRGCSTKDKVFYRECETHSYGESVEKMCFCSFKLCNSALASTAKSPHPVATALTLAAFWAAYALVVATASPISTGGCTSSSSSQPRRRRRRPSRTRRPHSRPPSAAPTPTPTPPTASSSSSASSRTRTWTHRRRWWSQPESECVRV